MKTKKKGNLFLLILTMLSVVSCQNNDIYFQYQQVNPDGWSKDSIYTFDINIPDTTTSYNMYINLRHTPDYSYQNLWLFLSQQTPDSIISKDTIEFYLANNRGEWLGTGSGGLKEMPVLYEQNKIFKKAGIYQISICHGMRNDLLKGVNDIGIRVERTEKP